MKKLVFIFLVYSGLFYAQTLQTVMDDYKQLHQTATTNLKEMLTASLNSEKEAKQWLVEFIPQYLEFDIANQQMMNLIHESTELTEAQKNQFASETDFYAIDNALQKINRELKDRFNLDMVEWTNDYLESELPNTYEFLLDYEAKLGEIYHNPYASSKTKKLQANLEMYRQQELLKNVMLLEKRLNSPFHQAILYNINMSLDRAKNVYDQIQDLKETKMIKKQPVKRKGTRG